MKKYYLILISLLIVNFVFAKKVKFSVDLTGLTPNPLGVHIAGDFQVIAGYGTDDWSPNTTILTHEGISEIYSIIVDIPAFTKYEFKFINGDQWYDSEFVPIESRVENPYNDNRWVYIDSLTNDTTIVGPLVFSGNAPNGKYLLRFKVDMQNQSISTNGVHVAGTFQYSVWNANSNRMCNLNGSVYETIVYVDSATYEYKFYNGNIASNAEIVPNSCAQNGNRYINVSADNELDTLCYSECSHCVSVINSSFSQSKFLSIYPNPTSDKLTIKMNGNNKISVVTLYDLAGKIIDKFEKINLSQFEIFKNNLPNGMYFIKILTDDNMGIPKQVLFN